jgi:hypothetical protein
MPIYLFRGAYREPNKQCSNQLKRCRWPIKINFAISKVEVVKSKVSNFRQDKVNLGISGQSFVPFFSSQISFNTVAFSMKSLSWASVSFGDLKIAMLPKRRQRMWLQAF